MRRPLQPYPQFTTSHYWAAASLKVLLDWTTAHPDTQKLGTSGSSLTHLISSQVCHCLLSSLGSVSSTSFPLPHCHPPSQSILITWCFLYYKPLLASSVPTRCLRTLDSYLLHALLQYCYAVVVCLPSLPPSDPPSPFFLFYTTTGINFKIVLQEYTPCIRRIWPEQNFFVFLCFAYTLRVVWNVSHVPPCLWNLSSFFRTLPPPAALWM